MLRHMNQLKRWELELNGSRLPSSDTEVQTIELYCALVIDAGGHGNSNSSARGNRNFYELALHKKHMEESLADIESRSSSPLLKSICFELQLSRMYPREIFLK